MWTTCASKSHQWQELERTRLRRAPLAYRPGLSDVGSDACLARIHARHRRIHRHRLRLHDGPLAGTLPPRQGKANAALWLDLPLRAVHDWRRPAQSPGCCRYRDMDARRDCVRRGDLEPFAAESRGRPHRYHVSARRLTRAPRGTRELSRLASVLIHIAKPPSDRFVPPAAQEYAAFSTSAPSPCRKRCRFFLLLWT